jgi:hypothetical protein
VRNALLGLLACAPLATLAQPYDVVFFGGRVIDPETNLDATRGDRELRRGVGAHSRAHGSAAGLRWAAAARHGC